MPVHYGSKDLHYQVQYVVLSHHDVMMSCMIFRHKLCFGIVWFCCCGASAKTREVHAATVLDPAAIPSSVLCVGTAVVLDRPAYLRRLASETMAPSFSQFSVALLRRKRYFALEYSKTIPSQRSPPELRVCPPLLNDSVSLSPLVCSLPTKRFVCSLFLRFCRADGFVAPRNTDPSGSWGGVRPKAVWQSKHRGLLFRRRSGKRGGLSRSSRHGSHEGCARALRLPEQRLRYQVGGCV